MLRETKIDEQAKTLTLMLDLQGSVPSWAREHLCCCHGLNSSPRNG